MRPIDVFAIAAAIVIALLSLIVAPWSGPWWIALLAATFVALWALLHILLGGSAKRIVRLTAILFLAVGIPSFGTWFYLRYPASLKIMQAWFPPLFTPTTKAALAPTLPPARKIDATWGKAYYKCKTNEIEPTKGEIEKNASDFKTYIEAWANAYGYKTPVVTAVAGGNKAELTPLGAGADPSKRTLQIVKNRQGIHRHLFSRLSLSIL
jgi:hypothetical protein